MVSGLVYLYIFNEDEGEHEGPSFVVIRYHHPDGIFAGV